MHTADSPETPSLVGRLVAERFCQAPPAPPPPPPPLTPEQRAANRDRLEQEVMAYEAFRRRMAR